MDRTRKRQLRSLNERSWAGEIDLYPVSKSLDSSLKKNTALIKRLRTAISAATLATFLQEIQTLSLHKYLSEIINACYEGLCRLRAPPDIDAAVEIVSALHQRFGPSEFTQYLGWLLGKGMATPDKSFLKTLAPEAREKEEKDRLVRQRSLVRVVTELWLVGVLRSLDEIARPEDVTKGSNAKLAEIKPKASAASRGLEAEPFPLEMLKDLLGYDREHANLPLLVIFVKSFSWDLLGAKPTPVEARRAPGGEDGVAKPDAAPNSEPDTAAEDGVSAEADQPIAPPELQQRFRNVLKRYFEDVKAHIARDQKSIQTQNRRNAEAYVKSGEVFEDRQATFEKLVKAQERLIANAQVIADVLGLEMPDTHDSEEKLSGAGSSIGLVKAGEYLKSMAEGAGIWEDEEERRFYENLVDLKGKVPAILLEDGKKKKDSEDPVGKKTDLPDSNEEGKDSKPPENAEDQSTAIANKNVGAQVDALLLRLPDMAAKDAVDQMAIDFCFLNSKASRNRLLKALTDVPRGRSDLLSPWSRLVATLGQYMPDIPKGLVDYLDTEFRSLQRRKEKDFLGHVRLSNIRYLAELTKFGIVPQHVVFHCLKVSLDDFSRMNIEIVCNLLENCGRYLLRNPETGPRMANFLETLQRKKTVLHIGQQERMLIENAIYYVDPPQRPAIERKERTPLEMFVRKLLYDDLTKRNCSKILKQLRRLHWEESEVVSTLEAVFTKPGKIKYSNINLLAILLSGLYRYHPAFVVTVIDGLIESITAGLEQNDFRFYQRRLAEVKYLSELYNYRMLEHPVIFDMMYSILTFGHGGPPVSGRVNPLDPPDDFFRIRLATTMLDTCGMFFSRGPAGKKLDFFLAFLQYYVFTKNPLPMDIEFVVQESFLQTRPDWKPAVNMEEAASVLKQAIDRERKDTSDDKILEVEDEVSESSSGEDAGEADGDLDEETLSESDGAEGREENYGDDGSSSVASNDNEDDLIVSRHGEQIDPEAEADFEREFAKMMSESLESRKFDRKPMFDAPLPVRSRAREVSSSSDHREGENETDGAGKMSFSLLTKKGNRPATRTVELPSDSQFARAMHDRQQAEREEKRRIKTIVMNYDLGESEDADGGSEKPNNFLNPRQDRFSKEKNPQRVRKLEMSDVGPEW